MLFYLVLAVIFQHALLLSWTNGQNDVAATKQILKSKIWIKIKQKLGFYINGSMLNQKVDPWW